MDRLKYFQYPRVEWHEFPSREAGDDIGQSFDFEFILQLLISVVLSGSISLRYPLVSLRLPCDWRECSRRGG